MTDTNKKLREALQAVIAAHEAGMREIGERMRAANQTSVQIEGQALIDAFAAIEQARQVLALPTAEQVDDINVAESFTSVTKTAAPVGEREAFEQFAQNCPMGKYNVTRRGEGYDSSHTQIMWDAWQARAALSAGDAVDAQMYRWLMGNCTLGIKQNGVGWSLNTTACIAPDCIKDVGATINAAMRKGQL